MRKPFMLIPAALIAVAVPAVTLAHANAPTPAAHVAQVQKADADNVDVQNGDQTAADTASSADNGTVAGTAAEAASTDGTAGEQAAEAATTDGDNIQSGDQTGPDTAGAGN